MDKCFRILLLSLLTILVLGCEHPVPVDPIQKIKIEASMEIDQDTKTYLSDLTGGMYYPLWDYTDVIAVYSEDVAEPSRFDLMSGENTTSATFSGPNEGTYAYGLYPYDHAGTFQNGMICMTLPYEQ